MYHTIYDTQSISTVSTFVNTLLSIYNLKTVLTDWPHLKCTHTLIQGILTATSLAAEVINFFFYFPYCPPPEKIQHSQMKNKRTLSLPKEKIVL